MPASHPSGALCESSRDSHIATVSTTEGGTTAETIHVDCGPRLI
jgi:hypothetical protein